LSVSPLSFLLFSGGAAAFSEFFEQRPEALPRDEIMQLGNAGNFAGHGLVVLNGAEQSSSSFGLAVAFHHGPCGSIKQPGEVTALRKEGFQRLPENASLKIALNKSNSAPIIPLPCHFSPSAFLPHWPFWS
jgi:hypothetical protein